MHQKRDLGFRS